MQQSVDLFRKDLAVSLAGLGYFEDEVIMTCVAMGWPNEEFSANQVVSRRVDTAEVASFIGFDD